MKPATMRTAAFGVLILLTTSASAAGGPPSARWIGQDGKDFVGTNNRQEPNDVQDVHIALSNLDPARAITFIDILYLSGDPAQWQYTDKTFSWKIELKRAKGSSQADLYIEPSHWEGARLQDADSL